MEMPGRHSRAGRIGRGANPPPQFGQTSNSFVATHSAQNVHSKVQIRASGAAGGRSLSQYSQFGRSSSTILPPAPMLARGRGAHKLDAGDPARQDRAGKEDLDRMRAPFDAAWYLAQNPDVAAAGFDARMHFDASGRAEGRLPCDEHRLIAESGLFDANYYLIRSADVLDSGQDPIAHFVRAGAPEGRKPNLYFETLWYRETHRPPGYGSPLAHYIVQGEEAGLRPSLCFDPAWYRATYAIREDASPLAHYLAHRGDQRYSPVPGFDPAFYMGRYGEGARKGVDPFAHYLMQAVRREVDPAPWFNAEGYRASRMGGARGVPLLHFLAERAGYRT
jgi:hypothetical protein